MYLHALVIVVLRRDTPPRDAVDLFHRIWSEQGDWLAENLPVRWLISAATTFAEHGQTSAQRVCGIGMSTMFDMIKLHDSERRMSGQPGHTPFQHNRGTKRPPLAFDMKSISPRGGDIDKNMLARIWLQAREDATVLPLVRAMLKLVMTDERSIFARIEIIRFAGRLGQ